MRYLIVSSTIDDGILRLLEYPTNAIEKFAKEATAAGEKRSFDLTVPLGRMVSNITIEFDPARPNRLKIERPNWQ